MIKNGEKEWNLSLAETRSLVEYLTGLAITLTTVFSKGLMTDQQKRVVL